MICCIRKCKIIDADADTLFFPFDARLLSSKTTLSGYTSAPMFNADHLDLLEQTANKCHTVVTST